MSIFEQATRQKLRFSSTKGELTVEQLWDLHLQSKQEFDLDTLAKGVKRAINNLEEESFVKSSTSPVKDLLELKLAILVHIIGVKIKASEEASASEAKARERAKLVGILADKKDEALKALTPDEITKRLAELV